MIMVGSSYLHMRLLRMLLTAAPLPLVCLMIPRDVMNTITLFSATCLTFSIGPSIKVAMPERTLFLTPRTDPVSPRIISASSNRSTVSTKLLNIGVDKYRLESTEGNMFVVAKSGLTNFEDL